MPCAACPGSTPWATTTCWVSRSKAKAEPEQKQAPPGRAGPCNAALCKPLAAAVAWRTQAQLQLPG